VSDWFDARVGGHGTRDAGQTGAIYRIAPKGAKLSIPTFDLNTTAGQIEALKNPSPNVRELGRGRLAAAGEASIPAVKALLNDKNGYIQARATWLLAKLGPKGIAEVEKRLSHSDPQMRVVAFRALRHENHKILELAAKMATDQSPLVRREIALAMRYVPFEQSKDILLQIGDLYDGKDRYYLEAWGLGCTDKEEKIYAALQPRKKDTAVYPGLVWRLNTVSGVNDLKGWAMAKERDAASKRAMLFSLSLIDAPQAAQAMVDIAKSADDNAVKSLAGAFIDKRNQGIWNKYKVKDLLAGKPAGPVTYSDMLAPTEFAKETTLPDAAAILVLKGDATAGKKVAARCYMCHKIGDAGVEFGPALAGWGKGQSHDVILKALLEPSADLAHGFEGTELTVTGGKRLQGFIQAEGDPVVIRVFGGSDVVVSKADIKSRKKLTSSLMVPASKMGLSAQELRDVVEYLKTH
jgi:putative heme-binding domain-containing protein